MAIGELQLVIQIHLDKRQQLSRQEKGMFGSTKTVNYWGNPPCNIYLNFTNHSTGAVTRYNVWAGTIIDTTTYYDRFSSSSATFEVWAVTPQEGQVIMRNALIVLSKLSDSGWKVRKAADSIRQPINELCGERGMLKVKIPRINEYGFPIVISTDEEP